MDAKKAETFVLRHASNIRVYDDKTWAGNFATEKMSDKVQCLRTHIVPGPAGLMES